MAVRIRLKRIGAHKALSIAWLYQIPVPRVMVVLLKKSVLTIRLLTGS